MAFQLIWAFIVASLLCGAASQPAAPCTSGTTSGTCNAEVSVQPYMPGHGSFIYNNIVVTNTGTCGIARVFVDITLPPYEEPFSYNNVSNATGELFGLPNPMAPGRYDTPLLYYIFLDARFRFLILTLFAVHFWAGR